ncbi:MAG: 3-hydroxybutyrate dehydrogenase [Anaerolineae bacterium]|nr:3-hydroxybutyrate dehydrogenase [Thermoflexales bacterium]MCX7939006.1 3-hydroxybutyrate dehydrogenase [Thermoflexales bacterium]MDW8053934.1 3-hydroxybutyrate dehydrogenase [Anaerolineae bacterium]MDW8292476.1 3-hydroxybutyrate dehydrogenase [Anaerolineae bacterium]
MLSGKIALVTGAGSGIGRAIAEAFAHEGARVIVHDVKPEAEAVARAVGGVFLQADLADPAAVRALAQRALEWAGGCVDILVNNAGFQHVSPVEDFPEDVWQRMIQVMLTAPFQLIKYLLPAMKQKRWGRIINISSLHGLVASPYKSAYISAKHGLIGLTRTVALEAAEFGVTVNAICPAYVRTPLVEAQIADQARIHGIPESEVIERIMLAPAAIKRLIEPEEVAAFAVYLASDKAAIITGAAHLLDLGWTAR